MKTADQHHHHRGDVERASHTQYHADEAHESEIIDVDDIDLFRLEALVRIALLRQGKGFGLLVVHESGRIDGGQHAQQ